MYRTHLDEITTYVVIEAHGGLRMAGYGVESLSNHDELYWKRYYPVRIRYEELYPIRVRIFLSTKN